jgi:hypothetical protein
LGCLGLFKGGGVSPVNNFPPTPIIGPREDGASPVGRAGGTIGNDDLGAFLGLVTLVGVATVREPAIDLLFFLGLGCSGLYSPGRKISNSG